MDKEKHTAEANVNARLRRCAIITPSPFPYLPSHHPAAVTAFGVFGMPSPLTDAEGRPSLLSLGGGLLITSAEGGGGA